MKKVFRAIRQLNKLKMDENYRLFNAISHYEIQSLSKVFKQWKALVDHSRVLKLKEDSIVLEGRGRIEGVWLKAGWKMLKQNMHAKKEAKKKWIMVIKVNNMMMKQRAFDMIWKNVEMAREEKIGEEERLERSKQFY